MSCAGRIWRRTHFRIRRWHPLLALALVGLALMAILSPGGPGRASADPPSPPAAGKPAPKPPAANPVPAHPLDQPLQWLYEARKAHAAIQDYTCTLVKQERIGGRLQEQNIILMKIRSDPFSVNMKWLSPREIYGQEVSFILGRNGNKMRVNFNKGLKKMVTAWVAPNDPRVMQHSRHTILEAGLGSLIKQTIQNMEMERQLNKTEVRVAEYSYNNRPCYRIESTRSERNEQYYSYRSVLYIDKESKLPIRTENYDWPYPGGPKDGDLLEVFSFVDLRFNVGLTDADFVR